MSKKPKREQKPKRREFKVRKKLVAGGRDVTRGQFERRGL